MAFKRTYGVFALLLALTCSCGQTSTSKLAVGYGTDIPAKPWVVPIYTSDVAGDGFFSHDSLAKGTASLLCPNVLITAKHVVHEKPHIKVVANDALMPKAPPINIQTNLHARVWAEPDDIRYFQLHDKSFDDGIALIKLSPDSMDEGVRNNLDKISFPKLGQFSHWTNPVASMQRLVLIGYGSKFDKVDNPQAGLLLLHSFDSIKVDSETGVEPMVMRDGFINFKLNFDENISVTNGEHTVSYTSFQHSEPGDSGGPIILNALSDYIFGIDVGGLNHHTLHSSIAKDFGKKDRKGRITNQDEVDVRWVEFLKRFPSTYGYNVASEPTRGWVLETLEEWCPAPTEYP